jgi:large subunit ribosomal protein L23
MSTIYEVIDRIQVTEKATGLMAQNKYVFRVAPVANKIEIKRAVEELFKVRVSGVNTMNYTGKRKRERSMNYGKRSDWKRAVVTLHEGEEIPLG